MGYYQYLVLRDYGPAKATFERVSKMLPGSSEVPHALAVVTRRKGQWDQSVAYWERALALDPRNMELLMPAAETYDMLRQFPAALKLLDRALDITPNDPDMMAFKAGDGSKGGEHRNFYDCVKSRKATYAPAETGHRTITIAHLGNIAIVEVTTAA